MKNNKKLARNAIRARKAVKKRENEQNTPKQRKRIATRIASLIGCLLLVSALVVPCFADYNPSGNVGSYPYPGQPGVSSGNNGVSNPNSPTINLDYKTMFLDFYDISTASSDPLAYLLYSGNPALPYQPYYYQFSPPSVGSAIEYDMPVAFSAIDTTGTSVCIVDRLSGDIEYLDQGHWETSYTTSGNIRTILLKFREFGIENEFFDSMTIRISYDIDTLLVTSTSISGVGIHGSYTDYKIACSSVSAETMVMEYIYSMDFCNFTIHANFNDFVDFVNVGYYRGYADGYNSGYAEGKREWYERGMDEGYASGYLSGYFDGYDQGYDDGYIDGEFSNTSLQEAYDKGYQAAADDIDSGDFGRNLLGNLFTAPMEALKQFTLIEWVTEDGLSIRIDIMTIFSAMIGVALFVWFLKMFAGG